MIDLINELNGLNSALSASIKELERYGREKAETERDYKIKLRQEALKLRDGDMAVGMIDKTVYGIPEVADLRFKRDVAETMYKTAQEKINTLKLRMRLLDAQITREWGSNG